MLDDSILIILPTKSLQQTLTSLLRKKLDQSIEKIGVTTTEEGNTTVARLDGGEVKIGIDNDMIRLINGGKLSGYTGRTAFR